MDTETRFELCTRNLQEIITPQELRRLLETNPHPKGYVGFECSGLMHAGTGLIVGKKMSDYVEAGFDFIIFLADWHSWINNKLGGVMESIRIGGEYFKDCFTALGLPEGRVRYLWASELVDDTSYWERIVRIMKASSLKRILRAMPIMGRSSDTRDLESAWALYPAMQTSDIFQMDLDAACAGMDQRKVHMLVREIAPKLGQKTPVCLHSPLLPGLQDVAIEGTFDDDTGIDRSIRIKMSKSVEKGAIWVNDEPDIIREKYQAAFCPPKRVEGNPVLGHARMVVFPHLGSLEIERSSKYGGGVSFEGFEDLAQAYARGELHPLDLKNGVAEAFIKILEPVRRYFERKPENLERIRRLQVTR
ncbi:MAG: tyrosine--tRNA ligase [Candidatus Bathyarchaeota archaeon]|nr:MAG: tyrosine--tRNA ligase [Candidatus Bathyarchaeota archaeon]